MLPVVKTERQDEHDFRLQFFPRRKWSKKITITPSASHQSVAGEAISVESKYLQKPRCSRGESSDHISNDSSTTQPRRFQKNLTRREKLRKSAYTKQVIRENVGGGLTQGGPSYTRAVWAPGCFLQHHHIITKELLSTVRRESIGISGSRIGSSLKKPHLEPGQRYSL